MAVTEIHPITTSLNKALDYIENPDKTEEKMLCTGYACIPHTACIEFDKVRQYNDKKDGYLAFHLIQSFAPGETDKDTAHQIGIELADKLLKDRFQYVVATHIDKGHLHNHIMINSVSFKDFKKYHSTPNSYYYIRRMSDTLCKEHGLSVITPTKNKGKEYNEYVADKQGASWKTQLRKNIDRCIIKAQDWDEFLALMAKLEYEIKQGKHISFRADGQERFSRAKTLGENYTEERIKERIKGISLRIDVTAEKEKPISLLIDIENSIKAKQSHGYEQWAMINNLKMAAKTMNYLSDHNIQSYNELTEKMTATKQIYDTSRSKLKPIESRIKEIDCIIHDIEVYRQTKPIVAKLETVTFKEKYKREHESELILFKAAEKSLQPYMKDGKTPLIKELRAEQQSLYAKKDKLYQQYGSAKSQQKELEVIMKNVDMLIGKDNSQEREAQKKRSGELE